MMAKPVKSHECHYAMIQLIIMDYIQLQMLMNMDNFKFSIVC